MFKNLVTGQLSLSKTFWGWGFCGGLFLGLIGFMGLKCGYIAFVPLTYILKTILLSAVFSGVTFILRRKITVLGTIAFLILLVQIIMSGIMAVGLFPLLYQ